MQFPINFIGKKAANTAETVFLDKGTEPVAPKEAVDVILGPSLYWFREKVLPAKTVSAAKKLAPSVFDAIIPAGEYGYFVIKQNDENYWLFAYDEAVIAAALKHAGLRSGGIRNIYFAQTECGAIERPLAVGTHKVLAAIDGVVTILPSGYAGEADDLAAYFNNHARSEHRVPVNLYRNALLDKKAVASLTAVAASFTLIYGLNYLMASRQLSSVEAKQEKIADTYHLPQTSFERNGLVSSLEKKQQQQILLREKAKALFSLPLSAGSHLDSMTITTQKVSLAIALDDAKSAETVKKSLVPLIKIVSEKINGKTLLLEGTYE